MTFNQKNFGVLWFPSVRAVAYLKELIALNCHPKVIVLLKNPAELGQAIIDEFDQLGYSSRYFDPKLSVVDYAGQNNVVLIKTNATSINDEEVSKILDTQTIDDWLFTGGGIVKPHLFKNQRRFLHIHPGTLPEFRGSTCFYYSILANKGLAASAFYLTPELDKGAVLTACRFSYNIHISDKNRFFMDYVLDPWIRSQTLKKLLIGHDIEDRSIYSVEDDQRHNTERAFYVIHPLLRAMTIEKINQQYQASSPEGVFINE